MRDLANNGLHYGWANSPTFSGNQCKSGSDLKYHAQHESPEDNFPSTPLQACRTGTGTYRVTFLNNAFYRVDAPSVLVSSRASQGTYCNALTIDCGGDECAGSEAPSVDVRCYDRLAPPSTRSGTSPSSIDPERIGVDRARRCAAAQRDMTCAVTSAAGAVVDDLNGQQWMKQPAAVLRTLAENMAVRLVK